jgi:hypothetical protein
VTVASTYHQPRRPVGDLLREWRQWRRLSLHPNGMAPHIVNLAQWRAHLPARLRRQLAATGDTRLAELYAELKGYPGGEPEQPGPADVVVPLRYRLGGTELALFSMTAVIGTPMDVTIEELAIESFYPADQGTAAVLWSLKSETVSYPNPC